ncbi:hypothetical protein BDR26DRAFT_386720 [Obelidium mucronatum]|nr:hypothetical protein BDR26DRAFT_386720 [Obelidium mucronatum]
MDDSETRPLLAQDFSELVFSRPLLHLLTGADVGVSVLTALVLVLLTPLSVADVCVSLFSLVRIGAVLFLSAPQSEAVICATLSFSFVRLLFLVIDWSNETSAESWWGLGLLTACAICPVAELVYFNSYVVVSRGEGDVDVEANVNSSTADAVPVVGEVDETPPNPISITSKSTLSSELPDSLNIHKNLPDLPQQDLAESCAAPCESQDPANTFLLPNLVISFNYSPQSPVNIESSCPPLSSSAPNNPSFRMLDATPSNMTTSLIVEGNIKSTDALKNGDDLINSYIADEPYKTTSLDKYTTKTPETPSASMTSYFIHNSSVVSSINYMWAGDFQAAETILVTSVMEGKVLNCTRNMLHLAELRFLVQLTSGCNHDVKTALHQIKKSEALCLRVLGSSDELVKSFDSVQFEALEAPSVFLRDGLFKLYKLDVECCYADTLLFKGCYQILMGREIKGTSTLRTSWKVYQRIQNELSQIDYSSHNDIAPPCDTRILETERSNVEQCVSFGLAFFFAFVDIVPTALAKILQAMGFSGNKPLALEMLQKIIHSESIRSPLAHFVTMVDAASFLTPVGVSRMRKWADDPVAGGIEKPIIKMGKALALSKLSLKRWPQSPILCLLRYHMLQKLGEVNKAVVELKLAIESVQANTIPYPITLWFEMGCHLALQCEWVKAKEIFERIWNLPTDPIPPASSNMNGLNSRTSSDQQHLLSYDWFEFKPMSGLLLVACARASEGPDVKTGGLSFESAKHVWKEILLAISSRKVKQTRIIKFTTRAYLSTRWNTPSFYSYHFDSPTRSTTAWCRKPKCISTESCHARQID